MGSRTPRSTRPVPGAVSLIEPVVERQRQLIEESKHEAIGALSEGFATKMERLQIS